MRAGQRLHFHWSLTFIVKSKSLLRVLVLSIEKKEEYHKKDEESKAIIKPGVSLDYGTILYMQSSRCVAL